MSSGNHALLVQLGTRIRALRKKKRWTQTDMAVYLDMNRGRILDIERGKRQVGITTLQVIATGLDTTMANLLKGLWLKAGLPHRSPLLEKPHLGPCEPSHTPRMGPAVRKLKRGAGGRGTGQYLAKPGLRAGSVASRQRECARTSPRNVNPIGGYVRSPGVHTPTLSLDVSRSQ